MFVFSPLSSLYLESAFVFSRQIVEPMLSDQSYLDTILDVSFFGNERWLLLISSILIEINGFYSQRIETSLCLQQRLHALCTIQVKWLRNCTSP